MRDFRITNGIWKDIAGENDYNYLLFHVLWV